jgi:hypothetical protein
MCRVFAERKDRFVVGERRGGEGELSSREPRREVRSGDS